MHDHNDDPRPTAAGLTLRLLPDDGAPPGRPAAPPGPAPTLEVADWLDTFIEEVLDGPGTAPAAAPVAPAHKVLAKATPAHTEFLDLSIGGAATTVLSRVLLGYSPVIDPAKGVIATRLTVVPVRESAPVDAGALLEAIGEVWPSGGGVVSLNVASETLLRDLLRARPATNVMIEVPAFVAADPTQSDALIELARRDCALLLKGRPLRELPRAVLPSFKWSIIDVSEERRTPHTRAPQGVTRSIPHIQSGVRTMAQLRRSFSLGAIAVIGWPLHEPLADAFDARPDTRVVMDALDRIDQGDSRQSIDHVLMRDPVLALELLQHLAAEGQALAVETRSLGHAVSMIGRDALRRWLAQRLARSDDDITMRPANFAALRRGLLMRMLATGAGQQEQRGELFMCGVFSLLDRIYARPVGELLHRLALPERVRAALVDRSGPYFPLLELARAVESEVPHDIRVASEAVFMQPPEINRALLRSLLVASHLEQPGAARPEGLA